MRRPAQSRDSGFTLIELLFTMMLFGIMVAFVAAPYGTYRIKQQHVGSARELVGFLRRAQVRAVAEETVYRVDFASSGRLVTMYRLQGTTYSSVGTLAPTDSRISYSAPSFLQSDGTTTSSVYFYERGSASKGTVLVVRSGSSKQYTVNVEGLTARVSYS